MKILVAQIGARRHYAVPRALHSQRLLDRLVTDASADIQPWRWLGAAIPASCQPASLRNLLGRHVCSIPSAKICGLPWFAVSSAWDRRDGELLTEYWARRNERFCRLIVRGGFGCADTVYAFNGAALEIFRTAKHLGLRTVLDQTSAPWRWNTRLLKEERERWPGWEDAPAEIDESEKLSQREEAEWLLADRIICGSEFAAHGLEEIGGPLDRCAIISYPYCGNMSAEHRAKRETRRDGSLHVLFAGTLQLRKGVQYLLAACRLMRGEGVVFRLVGPSLLTERVMNELRRDMEVIGPVSRAEMADHYRWADVFVLPTLSEGSANVCYEAIMAGLPVITTPNAGVKIPSGNGNALIPACDFIALAEALVSFAARLREGEIIYPADLVLASSVTLERYGAELVRAIGSL